MELNEKEQRELMGAKNTRIPPSDHAVKCLRRISIEQGLFASNVNFTVRDKLYAFGYISLTYKDATATFKSLKKGSTRMFMEITDNGRAALKGYC